MLTLLRRRLKLNPGIESSAPNIPGCFRWLFDLKIVRIEQNNVTHAKNLHINLILPELPGNDIQPSWWIPERTKKGQIFGIPFVNLITSLGRGDSVRDSIDPTTIIRDIFQALAIPSQQSRPVENIDGSCRLVMSNLSFAATCEDHVVQADSIEDNQSSNGDWTKGSLLSDVRLWTKYHCSVEMGTRRIVG